VGKSEHQATRYKAAYFRVGTKLRVLLIAVLFNAQTAVISKSVASNDVLKLMEISPKYISLEGDANTHTV
jgi:hypothetical protein